MLVETVDRRRFHEAFKDAGRADQFSPRALDVLFDWYDELEAIFELDPIAICCDWTEYPSLEAAAADYGVSSDYLCEYTYVLRLPSGGVVVMD